MCRDGIQSILVKGCYAWSCQVKEEKDQRQGKVVREDMQVVGVSGGDMASRRNWRLGMGV